MTDATTRFGTQDLSAEEVSDAVWLAAHISAAASGSADEGTTHHSPSAPSSRPRPPAHAPPQDPAEVEESPPDHTVVAPPPYLVPVEEQHSLPPPPARSLLPELPPGLSKALRPVRRSVPSRTDVELDEEATAVAAAESGRWLPVQRPAAELPYGVLLVVDRSLSMEIWKRTATAFRKLLERQGAFSDVTTVFVDTDENQIESVRTTAGAACAPTQFADPTGRRIIVVLSDGVGSAWRTGSMFSVMETWAKTCHVTFVHVLPVDRWERTGVRVESRTLHGMPPVADNGIPVIALNARYLRRWAELVSGSTGIRLPVLVPPTSEETDEVTPVDDVTPDELVNRFWSTATPAGIRLAGLLAAAPLTRSVIRAIHGALLPQSSTWNVAEVFLSGLIHRVPPHDGLDLPVKYEFHTGVRRRLLTTISRDEAAHVLRVVEDVLGREEPSLSGLRNVIAQPDRAGFPQVTDKNAHFLTVPRDVLLAMTGPYRRPAQHLPRHWEC